MDTLVDWLRDVLRSKLEALRGNNPNPRSELDALLDRVPPDRAGFPAVPPSLANLGHRLELRDEECAVVAVLLAAAFAPELGRALGLLFDPLARELVTREAVAAVLGLPRTHRLTSEDALVRWSIVNQRSGELSLDPTIEARLLGRACRDPSLVERVALVAVKPPLPDWPVGRIVEDVRRAIAAGARSVRIWLRAPEGSGRRTLFAAVAQALGLTAAAVTLDPNDFSGARAALRLAQLEDLALAWCERVRTPEDLRPPMLQAWLDADRPPPPSAGVADLTVRIAASDSAGREQAWRAIVPAFGSWGEEARRALTDGWSARPGQLRRVALSGPTCAADAVATLQSDATQRLEGLCDILETPFEWNDLVLPASLIASLRELAHEARSLPRLWNEREISRLFPHGRSVAALFCGPSGTGKTMAVQVIARELGLPLFRIDLSRIVSKYIGETSQNLARVLGAARHTDAVVFFDEADALFGKRTDVRDAHDRYANMETDYLLQALDAWPGVALLASNKRNNIDAAFMRRMRMILDFPRAEAAERQQIWTRLGAAIVPDRADVLAPVLARASTHVELSGAQIKAALLTARAAAQGTDAPVSAGHIVRGIERELEKEGRGLAVREKGILLGQAGSF